MASWGLTNQKDLIINPRIHILKLKTKINFTCLNDNAQLSDAVINKLPTLASNIPGKAQ